MSVGLADSLLEMPTARQVLGQVLGDLRDGRSVLCLLPNWVNSSALQSALWDALGRWHLHIEEVVLSEAVETPIVAITEALGGERGGSHSSWTLADLIGQDDVPEVVLLDGFEELPERSRVAWLQLVVQWAQVCQGHKGGEGVGRGPPPALCILSEASKVPYPSDSHVLLNVRPWWKVPAVLEVGLLCGGAYERDSALDQWRAQMIPAIAGPDLALAECLWDEVRHTGAELAELLCSFARGRGWTRDECEALCRQRFPQDRGPLSSAVLYEAWARGLVHWTPEFGLEIHSAALALIGRQEGLEHRLWRGQVGSFLPKIDKVRLALCSHLSQTHGADWPLKWQQPEEEHEVVSLRDTPFACQWGHLKSVLGNCRELQRERQQWSSLVRRSWRIRNELAHYRPISLNEYEGFWRELWRGYETGLPCVS